MRILRPIANRACVKSAGRDTHIALTLAVALAISPTTALAGLKVSGDPGAVMVEAQNASIEEILTALSQRFNFRYSSSANLETQVTGTYQGPIRRVLTRILGDRDFFVKSSNGLVEVTVLEKGPTVSATAQAPGASQISPPLAAPSLSVLMPAPSAASLPAPLPGSADSAPGLLPEPQPSNVTLPRPVVSGAGPENIPVPPGPTSTAPDPT